MQIRCNFSDISYLSETQKNNFQFLNIVMAHQVILSSKEDNKQFIDTITSPSYSVSIMTLPGEGLTKPELSTNKKN